jgi:isopentenyl-diphosphate Delta-isomerase
MMTDSPTLSSRKADHIKINLEQDVRSGLTTGLENYRFTHEALPDLDLEQIDLSQVLFGRRVAGPLLISSMTGGTPEAAAINQALARAAQQAGVAMGLGSQRAAIEHPELAGTFQVRKTAPDILLFANLGAVQLNYRYSVDQCRQAVAMIEADALILHLNPLQEALQPEGDTRFSGLLKKIEQVCRTVGVPVIVKEVGWGVSEATARRLVQAGVAAIDVAGAGGTSWSQVEMYRMSNENAVRVAAAFRDWGIPTAESIRQVRAGAPELITFASGGLRDGTEIAKCLALGARLAGMAGPFLKAAAVSDTAALAVVEEILQEIRICMFVTGAANLDQLRKVPLTKVG